MAKITLKGNPINTSGEAPSVGSTAKDFEFVKNDLSTGSLYAMGSKYKVLNIFPSVDTGTCAMSVRTFNKKAASLNDVTVLNVSKDLPFAQKRFCGAEGIEGVEMGSVFKNDMAKTYGLEILDGPLAGLCSRVLLVLDQSNKVLFSQQVGEIADEPDYESALSQIS
ncbi:thiol peroxidase [bacterium]|nr:thiol peroxidase [bacterium]